MGFTIKNFESISTIEKIKRNLANSDIVKIESENIENEEIKGNFLYEVDDTLYFSKNFNNIVFEYSKNYKNQDNLINFDNYVKKFIQICSRIKNKPSLLFINYLPKNFNKILNGEGKNYKRNYNVLSGLNEDEEINEFNTNPCVTYYGSGFCSVLWELIETRSKYIPQNDIIVFFSEPESIYNMPSLDNLIKVARSRKVYFVLNFLNKRKYSQIYTPEAYQNIKNNCKIKFLCNDNGIVDVQP